jgi:hypothetical protein
MANSTTLTSLAGEFQILAMDLVSLLERPLIGVGGVDVSLKPGEDPTFLRGEPFG